MADIEGFAPIQGIFFATFHPVEGTKALYSVPESLLTVGKLDDVVSNGIHDGPFDGSQIGTDTGTEDNCNKTESAIRFDDIIKYVIPKDEFCGRLVSVKCTNLRVIGYPVSIVNPMYNRNCFKFNICLVFDYEVDYSSYEPVVRKLGMMFESLEKQSQILSRSTGDPQFFNQNESGNRNFSLAAGNSKSYQILDTFRERGAQGGFSFGDPKFEDSNFSIQGMIDQLYQDLNDYSECSIKINEGNSIDIKLFPNIMLPDVNILPCDVPISTIDLESIVDFYWDPNMLRITKFVDGVNNIRRIATLSNSDYGYTCLCIKHLMAYKCIILLDTFSFSNVYAVTSKIATFLDRYDVLSEQCVRYCYSGKDTNPLKNLAFETDFRKHSTFSGDSDSIHGDNKSLISVDKKNVAIPKKKDPYDGFDKESIAKGESFSAALYSYESNNMRESIDGIARAGSFNNNSFYEKNHMLTTLQVFELYTSFKQSRTVESWYRKQKDLLRFVDMDVRRFIRFGLLQGLLYRVYAYPILTEFNSDWLSNCDIYYVKKDEKFLSSINQRLSNYYRDDDDKIVQTEEDMQQEMDKLRQDEKFLSSFNKTNNLTPLREAEIYQRNYMVYRYKIKKFNEPTDVDNPVKNDSVSESISNFEMRSRFGNSSLSKADTRNAEIVNLQNLRSDNFIKLIKPKSAKDDKYYSLKSILVLKKDYLDKIKHFDVICTEFGVTKKTATKILKSFWSFHTVVK